MTPPIIFSTGRHLVEIAGRLATLGSVTTSVVYSSPLISRVLTRPTLAGMFFCSIGLMTSGPIEDIEGPTAVTVFLWLPVTMAAAFV